MDKVVLTKEQAEAIENIKEVYSDYTFIIKSHVEDSDGWLGKSEPLNDLNLDSLIRALCIGYEVEQTPEEKLTALYDSPTNVGSAMTYSDIGDLYNSDSYGAYGAHIKGYRFGMLDTLKTLGITIEGINGEETK